MSTDVGGLAEVLPSKFITLTEFEKDKFLEGIESTIDKIDQIDPEEIYQTVKDL